MKGKILYIVFITLLFLIVYQVNKHSPIDYRWQPTFSESDKQPFGAYAFDQLLENSWPQEYMHTYSGISNLELDEKLEGNNLLILASSLYLPDYETKLLVEYIRNGGNVLIASNYFSGYYLGNLLKVSTFPSLYIDIETNLTLSEKYQTVYFSSEETNESGYKIPASIVDFSFEHENKEILLEEENFFDLDENTIPENQLAVDSAFILSFDESDNVKSLRFAIGKGNLILVCNPVIFTNYGILNDSIQGYIWNHLAYLQDKPLIRTEYYERGSQGVESQSEFRYILSEKPLKWAFYLTLIAILIFMIFTAKRKQKVIPVIKKPVNNLLQFVRSIASLYLQRNNNADLILKKKIYWGDALKQKYSINIREENPDREFYLRVAEKTRQPVGEVRRLFLDLNAVDENTYLSDEEMIDLITKMNNIQ